MQLCAQNKALKNFMKKYIGDGMSDNIRIMIEEVQACL